MYIYYCRIKLDLHLYILFKIIKNVIKNIFIYIYSCAIICSYTIIYF